MQRASQRSRILVAPRVDNISPIVPRADTGAVRVPLRTLAGLEDFARVGAHYTRRDVHPQLAADEFKHCCLSCLVSRGVKVLDSEWHSFLECPLIAPARSRFSEASTINITVTEPCTVLDLCNIVTTVSADPRKAGALAHFALDIRSSRRHLFRTLSSNGPKSRMLVATRLTQLQS